MSMNQIDNPDHFVQNTKTVIDAQFSQKLFYTARETFDNAMYLLIEHGEGKRAEELISYAKEKWN